MTKTHWFLACAAAWNALLAVYNTGNSTLWVIVNVICAVICGVLFHLIPFQRRARRVTPKGKP